MLKKGFLILSGYFVLSIISSCCSNVREPYFEFWSAELYHSPWLVDYEIIGSHFEVYLDDLEFFAENQSLFSTSLYAMQPCPQSGHLGLKHPITKIDISVNQTYFDTIPKGQIINHLVYVNYSEDYSNSMLSDNNPGLSDYYDESPRTFLDQYYIHKNNIDTVHVFKFEIFQENGKKTTLFSNAITW